MANPLQVVGSPAVGPGRFPKTRGRWLRLAFCVVAVYALASFVVAVFTDYWWFDAIAHGDTWQRVWSSKISLLMAGATVAFIAVSLPLLFAERAAPVDALFTREDPLVAVRSFTATKPNFSRNLIAGSCAFAFGPIAMSWWNSFALFRYGRTDDFNDQPGAKGAFGATLGFFMMKLPFLSSLMNWLFGLLLVSLIITICALVLNGALRMEGHVMVAVPAARRLISVTLALLFFVRAGGFWLSRYGLALSAHGRFDGSNYVDRQVRSPAYVLMVVASILCALILVANLVRVRWDLIVGVVVAWLVVTPLVLLVAPAVWQRFIVSNEREREAPSIRAHLVATRKAFELDAVEERKPKFAPKTAGASASELRAASDALNAARVWDVHGYTPVTQNVVDSLQKANPQYTIPDVDVIPGTYRGARSPMLIGVREVTIDQSSTRWVDRHLSLVHGYGVVIAPGNDANRESPKFVLSGIPLVGPYVLTEPRVFFGERTTEFAVVGTSTKPVEIPGLKVQPTSVRGIQGVRVGSGIRRWMLSWRFRDLDLLLSKSINSQSKLLSNREITERVHAVAPFLSLDSNPYPVIDRGRVVWIVDAYVTSSTYPNSDRSLKRSQRKTAAALDGEYSYVRNSVRAVVDAYSGSVRFYRIDLDEPLAKAYARAYPFLFETARTKNSVIDVDFARDFPEVQTSIRYPSDLFDIRAALWGRVHVKSADVFFDQSDRWSLGASSAGLLSEKAKLPGDRAAPFAPPEYVVAVVDESGKPEFVVQQSLVARGRKSESGSDQRLRALLFARSDGSRYGQLVSVVIPPGLSYDSAASLGQQFSSDPRVSARETSNGLRGSKLINGEMQIVPVGDTLLYVRPVYVADEGGTLARLTNVTVGLGGKVGFGDSFAAALTDLVGSNPLDGAASSGSPIAAEDMQRDGGSVAEYLAEAARLFDEAQAALKAGDLGRYQSKVDELGRVIAQASVAARNAK